MSAARTVFVGGPQTGKTTYAKELHERYVELHEKHGGAPPPDLMHTDDLIEFMAWSEVSSHVADQWFTQPGPWIVEGCATVRALRKAISRRSHIKPCDVVVFLPMALVDTSEEQQRMAAGIRTIFRDIRPDLQRLGVEITQGQL